MTGERAFVTALIVALAIPLALYWLVRGGYASGSRIAASFMRHRVGFEAMWAIVWTVWFIDGVRTADHWAEWLFAAFALVAAADSIHNTIRCRQGRETWLDEWARRRASKQPN